MRRAAVAVLAFWLVSGLFVGIGRIAANPASPEGLEAGFVGRIGDERAGAGLAGYAVASDLVEVARRHAEEMRRQQRLHHNPRLGEDVQGWQAVGENVGVGPGVEEIHQKLMASPSHRDNILSARFTEVGVGVVVDGADVWVVQVFRLPRSEAAEPAPPAASSPEPAPTEPSPAPGPAGGAGENSGSGGGTASGGGASGSGGTVRAAGATSSPGQDRAAAPAPPPTDPVPTTTAPSPATTVAATSVEVPTTFAETVVVATDAATTAATVAEAPSAPGTTGGSTPTLSTLDADVREVTWPIGLSASMLVGVVAALAVHVGGARVPVRTGDRRSLLDVWELALAR